MEENYDESFSLRSSMEQLCQNSEKNTDNENNKTDEQKNIRTHLNNNNNSHIFINNVTNINYKNDNNENFYYTNDVHIDFNNNKKIIYDIDANELNQNKNINDIDVGEVYYNYHNYMDQNDSKKTEITNNINTINYNGKQINTYNEQINIALNELYNSHKLNLETKLDMQLLKKKNRRRTKEEIEFDKKINKSKEKIKIKTKLGRKSKLELSLINSSRHSKKADDNIMKKINSYFLESVRNWLNNSFLDENGNFQTIKRMKKLKKKLFLKIKPNLITINLKRSYVINIINEKFKNILSNDISIKYKTICKDQNKILIEEIYKENNQPFIIFILEQKFIDVLNYFSGQDTGENFKNFFLTKKYDKQIVEQFLKNFNRIGKFLSDINNKEKERDIKKTQDYIQRISLLCVNYKEWFENKFNRKENKKNSLKDME